ncbi:MAG: GtrA family protein [Firmicutes bacterium]|nr:GtrA family protein [Bacillota bacterium]
MEKLKNLFGKYINRETISYLIFGVLTTIVNYFVSFLVMHFCTNIRYDVRVNVATVVSWIAAVLFAYVTNKIYVFRSKTRDIKSILREMTAFFAARLLSFGFEIVWMNLTVNVLHWNFYISKLIAQVVIVILNYIFSKLFIFKKREE